MSSTYESMGVQVARGSRTETVEVMGIRDNKDFEIVEITLPIDTGVRATFSAETFGRKLLKIFTGELQTGDKLFDDAVYTSTDTKERTALLLQQKPAQDAIFECVTSGGSVSVSGAVVRIDAPLATGVDNPQFVQLVRFLAGR